MLTFKSVTYYKTDWFHKFNPCGTKFHGVFKCAADVAEGGSSDWTTDHAIGVDHMDAQTTDHDQKHVA